MKVLHINAGNLYGGIETFLVTLARHRHLCPQMEPHFGLCFEGRLSEELTAAGVPVHRFGAVRLSRPWTVWTARSRLRDLLRHIKIDRIICHGCWPQVIFGPAARSAGIPLIFWMHGAADGKHWLERWARRTPPDLAICNSRFTQSLLPNLYPGVPSEVIYYAVELPEITLTPEEKAAIRAEFDTPADAVVIIQVSRMEAWKGHRLHLEALALLRELPSWVCWMVGGAQRPVEERYLAGLKQLVADRGITDLVRFTGQRSDVPRLLRAADIFCQPNIEPEPFGIVFIEAMAAGLPVVTTAIGGGAEIVDEACGIVCPPDGVAELDKALRELIANPAFRHSLGRHGTMRARECSDPAQQSGLLRKTLESEIVGKTARVASANDVSPSGQRSVCRRAW